jgi:hypothetical protein
MRRAVLPFLLLLATPAAAQFEGRAEYALHARSGGEGHATVLVSKQGARTETRMSSPKLAQAGSPGGVRMSTLVRAAEPGRVYLINDERKMYSVMDPATEEKGDRQLEVERIGSDRIAGHACERARVTGQGQGHMELCITKDLGAIPMFGALEGGRRGNLFAALGKAGLDGLPVRWQVFDEEGKVTSTIELESATREKIPAGKLAIPAGYREGSAAQALASPEQQKQIEEAMKRAQEQLKQLPPEQRKQLEELMKQRGGGNP